MQAGTAPDQRFGEQDVSSRRERAITAPDIGLVERLSDRRLHRFRLLGRKPAASTGSGDNVAEIVDDRRRREFVEPIGIEGLGGDDQPQLPHRARQAAVVVLGVLADRGAHRQGVLAGTGKVAENQLRLEFARHLVIGSRRRRLSRQLVEHLARKRRCLFVFAGEQVQRRAVDPRIIGFRVAGGDHLAVQLGIGVARGGKQAGAGISGRGERLVLQQPGTQRGDVETERGRQPHIAGPVETELGKQFDGMLGCPGRGEAQDGPVLEAQIVREARQALPSEIVGPKTARPRARSGALLRPIPGRSAATPRRGRRQSSLHRPPGERQGWAHSNPN